MSSYLKKLAGETVIYGIGAVLPKVVNFLLVASYLTFQIDEDKYGIHGIMYSFVTLALVFFTLRMETTFFKFSSDASYEPKKVFNNAVTVVLGSAGLLMTLMLVFRSSISSALTRPEDSRFVVYFAVILFLDALSSVPFAQLRMTNRPVKFSAIRIVNSLITVGLIVFCFNILPHVSALHWMYDEGYFLDYTFLANLVGSFFVVLMLYKELSAYRFSWDKELVKKMFAFAWPLIIVGVAGSINQFSDRIFVSYLTESLDGDQNFFNAGVFTGAIKIAVIMNLFVTAFNYAAEPFFFKNTSKEARTKIYGQVALAFTICGMMIFLFVTGFLDILKFMIDEKYHKVLFVVPIALLANLFLGLYYNFSIWYKISGKTIFGALIATIGSIIFISLNFFLIPRIGMVGANVASLICFGAMTTIAYLLGQKYYPISYPIGKILLYLIFGVAFYYGVEILDVEGFSKIILSSIAIVAFGLIAYLLDFRNFRNRLS